MHKDALTFLGSTLDELKDLARGLILRVEENLVFGIHPEEGKVDHAN
jgi:hypothetical protein